MDLEKFLAVQRVPCEFGGGRDSSVPYQCQVHFSEHLLNHSPGSHYLRIEKTPKFRSPAQIFPLRFPSPLPISGLIPTHFLSPNLSSICSKRLIYPFEPSWVPCHMFLCHPGLYHSTSYKFFFIFYFCNCLANSLLYNSTRSLRVKGRGHVCPTHCFSPGPLDSFAFYWCLVSHLLNKWMAI